MISFWIICALFIAGALLFILPPLLKREETIDTVEQKAANISIYQDQFAELEQDLRNGVLDQEQYEQGRLELQRRLLEDVSATESAQPKVQPPTRSERGLAIMLSVAIPLITVLLYLQLGKPQAISSPPEFAMAPATAGRSNATSPTAGNPPGFPDQQEIEKRVGNLAARLKENPDDADGWAMLGRSYKVFGRYKEASEAYAKATALKSNDAQLWVDYAEALALANESRLQGETLAQIDKAMQKAVQLEPNNQRALAIAGRVAFEMKNYQQAATYWERLAKTLPAGTEEAQSLAMSIAEARRRAAGVDAP